MWLGAGVLGESSRRRIPSPRTGITGDCGLPEEDAGPDLEPSAGAVRAVTALNHPAVSLAPFILINI